ncbi:related to 40S ribosomal protein S18-Coprinopsis cinerea [Serendipita indica DSM 11827]|uniref:Related to 40S ribosomal protein S18-Coprinopsis cinerea n=1 Tax=Serendipita indica (strain DSM 11827) TaxID=1109443 RepID=G4TB34_SERID|nr:related to 40S ribosomal protein S18-Coprinopsis cinerea [Serendipita indica DSM 11827]
MSQLPTPGLPKPRYSGIPSAGKSGLPAPGIRARSTTTAGNASPGGTQESPVAPRTTNGTGIANGVSRLASRPSNASNVAVSPEPGTSKGVYGTPVTSPSYNRGSFTSNGPRASLGRPPSSASATSSRYGEQGVPVTPPRRQSLAYGTGSAVKIGGTPRSAATSRSESRTSDAYTRDSSRASQRPLEVGDPVKIESLGLEGTLRFLGEIDGKPGHWAGVELSGSFAGKGKNDGSVAGVPYFSCPPKCGVFVASTKITPNPAAVAAIVRPPSSASSIASPISVRQRKASSSAQASLVAQSRITEGSRASKYIGITAKQLSTRNLSSIDSPSPSQVSPVKPSPRPSSPPRPTMTTTQTTPKAPRASFGLKPRTSVPALATPRPVKARLSTLDMPPPPVPDKKPPLTPASSTASNDFAFVDEPNPDTQGYVHINGTSPLPSPSPAESGRSSVYATPSPEPSYHIQEIQRLNETIQSLEAQNKVLQAQAQAAAAPPPPPVDDGSKAILEEQAQAALKRVTELEASLRTSEKGNMERQSKLESLERQMNEMKEETQKIQAEGETRTREVKVKLEESEALVASLKNAIDARVSAASENDAVLTAKQAEIEVLQGQVARLSGDLERERSELGIQVQELRSAGQETIALYEERIHAFEAERYDMEAVIASLEEKLRNAEHVPSPEELAQQASTAAQIDNETLKEQIAHLNQRISHLEDQLEEAQVAAEREEAAVQTKLARYKEKDAQRQQELEEARRLASTTAKSESSARTRIEELEAALRENTIALEDARAEIESLRTDLTNLENSTEPSERPLEPVNTDHTAAVEAKHLKALLDASKLETQATAEQLAASKAQAEESARLVKDLRELIESLEKEKAEMQKSLLSRPKDESSKRSSTGSTSSRTKDDNLRDQVSGLKIMMQELQKENTAYASKIRSLETENKILVTETEDLKEAVKTLEQAIDDSIQREEQMLKEEQEAGGSGGGDSESLQRSVREARLEVDQLRKKLADAEKKSAKTISELNKEVADLESLVEAKIYREDDLEREIERLKDKLQRAQSKSSKSSGGDYLSSKSMSRSSHTRSSTVTQQTVSKQEEEPANLKCDVCEQSGHDIFNCPILKDDSTPAADEPYCVDCDSHGHSTVDCPHAHDVF